MPFNPPTKNKNLSKLVPFFHSCSTVANISSLVTSHFYPAISNTFAEKEWGRILMTSPSFSDVLLNAASVITSTRLETLAHWWVRLRTCMMSKSHRTYTWNLIINMLTYSSTFLQLDFESLFVSAVLILNVTGRCGMLGVVIPQQQGCHNFTNIYLWDKWETNLPICQAFVRF